MRGCCLEFPHNQGNLAIKTASFSSFVSRSFQTLPAAMGGGRGTGAAGRHGASGLPAGCALWSSSRSAMHLSRLHLDGAGPTQADDLVVLVGSSHCMVAQCPALRGSVCPRAQSKPEVVFQKTFSPLPQKAGPRSRTPGVCVVFLPLGLATNSMWHLIPPLTLSLPPP